MAVRTKKQTNKQSCRPRKTQQTSAGTSLGRPTTAVLDSRAPNGAALATKMGHPSINGIHREQPPPPPLPPPPPPRPRTSCCCICWSSLRRYFLRRLLILPACLDLRPLPPCERSELLPSPPFPSELPDAPPSPDFLPASSRACRSARLITIRARHSWSGPFASSSEASRTFFFRSPVHTYTYGEKMQCHIVCIIYPQLTTRGHKTLTVPSPSFPPCGEFRLPI